MTPLRPTALTLLLLLALPHAAGAQVEDIAAALALAGGVTPDGKQDKIELRRDGRTLVTDLSASSRISTMSLLSGDQIFVPERSWISRNAGVFAAAISAAVTIVVAITR